jgi:hypothetical protein
MQISFFVELFELSSEACDGPGVRRHVIFFDAREKMRRTLQIESQRDVLREVMSGIPAAMRQIPVAHSGHGRLRVLGEPKVLLHFVPDIDPLRVGNVQVDVVAAGIHRRQHGEQGLAGIQRNGIIAVGQAHRRQQPDGGRQDQTSKPANQETTQESLPQDGEQR